MTTKATGHGSGYGWGAVAEAEAHFGGGHIDIRQHFTGPEVKLQGRTYVLPDFRPAVKRGMKLLDAHMPDWWKHIDTSVLDLRDENMCILGQSWQHYANGEDLVATAAPRSRYAAFCSRILGTDPAKEAREQSAKFGFNLTGDQGRLINYQRDFYETKVLWRAAWEHLTATWLVEIRKRELKVERKALKLASR